MDEALDAAIAHITQAVDCLASVRVAGSMRETEKRAAVRNAQVLLRQTLADLCERMNVHPKSAPARRVLIENVMIGRGMATLPGLEVGRDAGAVAGDVAGAGEQGDVTIAR